MLEASCTLVWIMLHKLKCICYIMYFSFCVFFSCPLFILNVKTQGISDRRFGFQADFCNYSHWGTVNRIKTQILNLFIQDEVSPWAVGILFRQAVFSTLPYTSVDINVTQIFESSYGNRLDFLELSKICICNQ